MAQPTASHDSLTVDEHRNDRREKLAAYKRMSGLRAYLIVAQDRRWVEHHLRGEDNLWHRGDLIDEGRFAVPRPETELTLEVIYEALD
jgi:Uma2 family endonuclease